MQVLQKSIDYIQYLLQQRRRQEEERNALRKDVVALRIMQANYEQIVKAQHSVPGHNEQRLTDQDKFQVVSIPLCLLSFPCFSRLRVHDDFVNRVHA